MNVQTVEQPESGAKTGSESPRGTIAWTDVNSMQE